MKKNKNYVIFRKMNGTIDHHVKQNKPDSDKYCTVSLTSRFRSKKRKKAHEHKSGTIGREPAGSGRKEREGRRI
jgi:hypothetical protein